MERKPHNADLISDSGAFGVKVTSLNINCVYATSFESTQCEMTDAFWRCDWTVHDT